MSELEQLRQEAEQLRNQIRVRQHLCVYREHLCVNGTHVTEICKSVISTVTSVCGVGVCVIKKVFKSIFVVFRMTSSSC